jgi:transposase
MTTPTPCARPFQRTIRFVVIDPAAVYAKVTTPGLLPNATLIVGHLHLVKLANDAVTKVRRQVAGEQHGRRDRKIDLAWANRRWPLTLVKFTRLGGELTYYRGFSILTVVRI